MADDTIKFDLRDFERAAKRMGAAIDQVPYALKNVMNDAAFATRQYLSNDVWPGHLMQRNKRFPAVALNVDKATKTNLSVSIFDRLGRGNLLAHAKGGTARPRTGKLAAVPSKAVRVGPRGVVPSQRPRMLARAFRRGNMIFQRVGKKSVRLMFTLVGAVRIKKDVPLYESFAENMRREIAKRWPEAIAQAMKTRR